MTPIKTIYPADRQAWRTWLSENFQSETEIWCVFPMKSAAEPGLSYNDMVEEALCFGWIDSTVRNADPTHRAQRFTPRRKGSTYSRPNIERLLWLESRGLIHPSVRPEILALIQAPYEYPADILDVIRRDSAAWTNFENFPEPYKRIRVAYIDAARKRPHEFQRRLESFLRKTRENKRIMGYGGIEKYYS